MRTMDPQWRWTGPEVPRVKPFFKSILTTAEGRIWASVSTPSERFTAGSSELPWREQTAYDVFEPDGTYVGQVSAPFGVSIAAVRGEDVWGIVSDSDDEQTLQLFRVVWR